MTRDEAIHAAIEAGMTCYGAKSEKLGHSWHSYTDSIERFARLVAAKEREECAKVCEAGINNAVNWDSSQWDQACEDRAAAIRARKL